MKKWNEQLWSDVMRELGLDPEIIGGFLEGLIEAKGMS